MVSRSIQMTERKRAMTPMTGGLKKDVHEAHESLRR